MSDFLNSVATLAALNSVSYLCALGKWCLNGENGADLVFAPWSNPHGKVTVYLVAGCGNQPEQAFEFIRGDLREYKVINVRYKANRGCDMLLIANQVIDDIVDNNYQNVLIIGCSIGDYVSRFCEDAFVDRAIHTIAINPEPDSRLLKPWARIATRVGVVLAYALHPVFGWLFQLPLYSDCGNHFSLHFMVSQFSQIGFCKDAPRTVENLLGIILAEPDGNGDGEDEFLLGPNAMRAYFGEGVDAYSAIGVGHGNTVKGAAAYKKAWNQLWSKAKAVLDSER